MRGNWLLKGIKIIFIALLAGTVTGFVIKGLWNWLVPAVFGLHAITFWQALGLFILCKLLFGGFHRHSGHRGRWKQKMIERWERMTPEEREKFREGMRGCRPRSVTVAEPNR